MDKFWAIVVSLSLAILIDIDRSELVNTKKIYRNKILIHRRRVDKDNLLSRSEVLANYQIQLFDVCLP